jgi:hypothetical protein
VNDLSVVQVAKAINELIDEVLSFGYSESLALFDKFEHVLSKGARTPWLHS